MVYASGKRKQAATGLLFSKLQVLYIVLILMILSLWLVLLFKTGSGTGDGIFC